MSILGNRVLRKEDPKFLTVGGSYVDDLKLEGAAHVTYVRSTMAHARILSIDVDEARSAPGVLAVLTAADIDLAPIAPNGMMNSAMVQQWLASDITRFVGEAVAIVITEERYQGTDAAELVFVDYEPLPVLIDQEAAVGSEVQLFPEAGTNVSMKIDFGEDPDFFAGCDVVVRQRIVNQRVAPCPLEVRAAACRWSDDGRVTQWASTQGAHSVKGDIAKYLGIEPEDIRVIAGPDVGGGFGAKIGVYTEELLLPWLSKRVGRPLKWVETRSESMVNLGHGRGQVQHAEIGGTRDGRVLAYRLDVVQDGGAYPKMGSILPFMTRTMLGGVYDIPKMEFHSRSVVTNTTPTVAYRGAGRPEATAAIERAMDLYAAEIGMDPVEVRRKNLIAKDAFPFTTPVGTTYDIGDYDRALDLVLEAAGYTDLRAEQQRRRESGDRRLLGIGLSVYVEITAGPGSPREFGAVEVKPDGKVIVRTGSSSHGQGHATAFSMLVADRLGVELDDVEVIHGDTDIVPRGQGTMGSRSLQAGGTAIVRAADQVVNMAKSVAADLLEASAEDIVFDPADRQFHVAGTPAVAKTWDEVATVAHQGEGLAAEIDYKGAGATFPFGAHLVVVEVDRDTGKVEVKRIVAVDDAGRILNPLLADGQVHGGLAQGVAQALLEEVLYDEDGNPVTSNLADYAFISAAELPSFERTQMETPTPLNDLGAKGIGESGTIGSTPAVHNAVIDAVAHLGVRHIDMPCTAEKVWRAIGDATT